MECHACVVVLKYQQSKKMCVRNVVELYTGSIGKGCIYDVEQYLVCLVSGNGKLIVAVVGNLPEKISGPN